jgi:hypothetical protein
MEEQPNDADSEDFLEAAEREMAEEELGLFRKLMAAASARAPSDRVPSDEEIQAEIEALVAESPELREAAERLAVRHQFRSQADSDSA